jgi:hypothetical protein
VIKSKLAQTSLPQVKGRGSVQTGATMRSHKELVKEVEARNQARIEAQLRLRSVLFSARGGQEPHLRLLFEASAPAASSTISVVISSWRSCCSRCKRAVSFVSTLVLAEAIAIMRASFSASKACIAA